MAPEDVNKTAFRVPGAVGLCVQSTRRGRLVRVLGYDLWIEKYRCDISTRLEEGYDIFHDLIGKLVEIYIDDVVVKSTLAGGHLEDLRKVLERTRKFGLKMNSKKCAFGISAG